MAVLNMIVAWALYMVFEPVNRNLALLAGWFRIAYAGVFLIAISQLVGVLSLLNNADYLAVFSTEQLHTQVLLQINAFNNTWSAALILFGFHSLLLGYLAYTSGYVHKLLGVLLVVAGVGYVIDSFGVVLLSGYSAEVAAFTFIAELLLIFWLFVNGRRVDLTEDSASIAESATHD